MGSLVFFPTDRFGAVTRNEVNELIDLTEGA